MDQQRINRHPSQLFVPKAQKAAAVLFKPPSLAGRSTTMRLIWIRRPVTTRRSRSRSGV